MINYFHNFKPVIQNYIFRVDSLLLLAHINYIQNIKYIFKLFYKAFLF